MARGRLGFKSAMNIYIRVQGTISMIRIERIGTVLKYAF